MRGVARLGSGQRLQQVSADRKRVQRQWPCNNSNSSNSSVPQRCCRAISVRNCLNYKRNQLLSLQSAGQRGAGAQQRDSSRIRLTLPPRRFGLSAAGGGGGRQDWSCTSHVPQGTRNKFVTTNAWVQFEMCFFLAYAVRVSNTETCVSERAQRGQTAKLWGGKRATVL